MIVTREELNPCTLQLNVVCDVEQVKSGLDKAFKQISKKIKLPGFRPGHAPRAMLEGLVPNDELFEQAADLIFRSTYQSVLEQESIEPDVTTRPQVEVTKIEKEPAALEYTVKIPLPPQIELGEYKNIPVEQAPSEVNEEEIDAQIDEFRKGRGKHQVVTDRVAQEGDVAVINIKLDDDPAEGRVFMVVVGQTRFPDLDLALLDMRVEDMKSLELEFPDTFQDKEWAGQKKHAQLTLNSLSAVQLPPIDDDFAKSLEIENLETLRSRLREIIGSAKIKMSRDLMVEKLLDTLHERSKIHVSDNMWEDLATRRLREQAEEQHKQGKSLEEYATEVGMSLEELVAAWRSKAKLHVERALMIREIFKKEEMSLSNTELNQELFLMANEYGAEPEEMLRALQENQALEELHYRAISHKVSDFLLANADLVAPGALPASAAGADSAEVSPAASVPEPEAKPAAAKRVRASSVKTKEK